MKGDSKQMAASNYIKAANCFKKSNINHAIECLQVGVDFYTEEGDESLVQIWLLMVL